MIADHVVAQRWRHAQADALDAQIDSIREALAHLANVEELLEARGEVGDVLPATRTIAAQYRDLANTLGDEAGVLRAAVR